MSQQESMLVISAPAADFSGGRAAPWRWPRRAETG